MSSASVAGRIWQDGALRPGILHFDTETGTITKVARTAKSADHTDLGDLAILPAAIDVHVHFREPGLTHKEDLHSGSVSAAFGGVTAFVDMPNTTPPTTTMKALRQKMGAAAAKSVVDYGAWCGASWFLDDLPEMLPHAAGVKLYLGATTGDLLMDDSDRVRKALRIAGEAGKPVIVHAEAQRVLEQFRGTETALADHNRCRPPLAEVESIYDVMKLLPGIPKPPRIHIAHIASSEAVQAARAARFSTGVCPHHLFLDTDSCPTAPTHGKMNPPLRDAAQRDALWRTYAAGEIPIVESDHAPHTTAEKQENFHQAPAGVPGVETMVPLLLARVAAGELDLATVVSTAAAGPANMLGLAARGSLAPGAQADWMAVDLDDVRRIEPGDLHSKATWTPYEGMDAVFPRHVWSHGCAVIDDGDLVAAPGAGRPLWPLPGEA